jgi:hypothetical protein
MTPENVQNSRLGTPKILIGDPCNVLYGNQYSLYHWL